MSKKFESLHKIYLMVRLFPLILKQSFLKSSTISFNIAVTFFLHILWRTFYKYLLSTHYIPGTLLGTWWACGKAKIPYIHRDYIIFQKMISKQYIPVCYIIYLKLICMGNGKVNQGKRTSIEMAQLVLDQLSVACNNF